MAKPEENVIVVAHGIALGVLNMLWLGLAAEALNKEGLFGSPGGVFFLGEKAPKFGSRHVIRRFDDGSYVL